MEVEWRADGIPTVPPLDRFALDRTAPRGPTRFLCVPRNDEGARRVASAFVNGGADGNRTRVISLED